MGVAEKTQGAPLPAKLAGLLREAKWLAVVALGVFLLVVLASYRREDPAWSHSGTGALVGNAGGPVGAWISDILLYVFGLSAYWWVALAAYIVARST